jgi:hypothetical protein
MLMKLNHGSTAADVTHHTIISSSSSTFNSVQNAIMNRRSMKKIHFVILWQKREHSCYMLTKKKRKKTLTSVLVHDRACVPSQYACCT